MHLFRQRLTQVERDLLLFRQGIEYSTDGGTPALVVWVKKQSNSSTTFKISPESALAGDFNGDGIINFLDLAMFARDEDLF